MGVPEALRHLSFGTIATAAGLALLLPVLPHALEMLALRRMKPAAFGSRLAP